MKANENTRLWHAQRVRDPVVRKQIVDNLIKQNRQNYEISGFWLSAMFLWDETPEGHSYWKTKNIEYTRDPSLLADSPILDELPDVYQVQCPNPVPNEWDTVCRKASKDSGGGLGGAYYKIGHKSRGYSHQLGKWPDIPVIEYSVWKAIIMGEGIVEEPKKGQCYTVEYVKGKSIAIVCDNEKDWYKVSDLLGYEYANNWRNKGKQCIYTKSRGWDMLGNVNSNTNEIISASIFIEANMKEHEYKVGDYVVITKDTNGDPVGTISKVQSVTGLSVTVRKAVKGHITYDAAKTCIRPATQEEIDSVTESVKKFNVGDWVTVLDTPNVRYYTEGKRAIGYTLQIPNDDIADVLNRGEHTAIAPFKYSCNYTADDLRLATEEEIQKATQAEKPVETRKLLSFKTEDGYDLYEGDTPVWIYKRSDKWEITEERGKQIVCEAHGGDTTSRRLYHSQEVAEKWVEHENEKLQQVQYTDNRLLCGTKGPEMGKIPEPWSIVCTDGVRVYEKTRLWWLYEDGKSHWGESILNKSNHEDTVKKYPVFSTYEAAEEYRKQCIKADNPQYQVGDEVELSYKVNNQGYTHPSGTRSTITGICKKGVNVQCIIDHPVASNEGIWCYKDIRKVEPRSKYPEYKVGQRVLVHSGANISGYNGEKGIIDEICNPTYDRTIHIRVKFDKDGSSIHCYDGNGTKVHIEILQDAEKKPDDNMTHWQVGDWIVLINSGCICSSYKTEEDGPCTIQKGDVVQILEISPNGSYSTAMYRTTKGWISGGVNGSRKASIEEIPKPVVERKWKVGDRFKIGTNNIIHTIDTIHGSGKRVKVTWNNVNGNQRSHHDIDYIDRTWGNAWIPYSEEPILVTKENAYIGMQVIRGEECAKKVNIPDEVGTIITIDSRITVMWPKKNKMWYTDGKLLVATANQTNNNQSTNNTKNQQNGNKQEISSTDNNISNSESYKGKEVHKESGSSSSSKEQYQPASYIRIYPKVTSGQGYSTGKVSSAAYKVKPQVTEGYHREYTRC